MKKLLLLVCLFSFGLTASAQKFSASGQLGWILPGGDGVGDGADQFNVKGGLVYDLDALYHLDPEKPKIGVGVCLLFWEEKASLPITMD